MWPTRADKHAIRTGPSTYPLPPTDTIRLDIAGRKLGHAILILKLDHPLYDMWSKWPSPLMAAIAFLKAFLHTGWYGRMHQETIGLRVLHSAAIPLKVWMSRPFVWAFELRAMLSAVTLGIPDSTQWFANAEQASLIGKFKHWLRIRLIIIRGQLL